MNIFEFEMGDVVKVTLNCQGYTGEIISRLETRSAGKHYAVFADYTDQKCGRRGVWFSEQQLLQWNGKIHE